MVANKDLKKRIIEISYKHKLSHLGSCLTAVDIIEEIYQTKRHNEKFILSSGHAGLALYVVLEKHQGINAEGLFAVCGIHPDRIEARQPFDFGYTEPIHCSTGSLGQGLPIAVGMALSDREKDVYCLISDGECAEGSIYEALRIAMQYKLDNLKLYVNDNGWAAYQETNTYILPHRLGYRAEYRATNVDDFPFLKGQDAHYYVMNDEDYTKAMEILI